MLNQHAKEERRENARHLLLPMPSNAQHRSFIIESKKRHKKGNIRSKVRNPLKHLRPPQTSSDLAPRTSHHLASIANPFPKSAQIEDALAVQLTSHFPVLSDLIILFDTPEIRAIPASSLIGNQLVAIYNI